MYPAATFPKASSAVTVTANGTPAVTAVNAGTTEKTTALPGRTVMPGRVPVIPARAVSATATDSGPAVFRVTANVLTPPGSVASPGSPAEASELVKWTVPVYPVATFP